MLLRLLHQALSLLSHPALIQREEVPHQGLACVNAHVVHVLQMHLPLLFAFQELYHRYLCFSRMTDLVLCLHRPLQRSMAQPMAPPMKKRMMRMTSAWRPQLIGKPSDPQMPSTMTISRRLRSVLWHLQFASNFVVVPIAVFVIPIDIFLVSPAPLHHTMTKPTH